MNAKMFILSVSCLIFSKKLPLSLNSRPMGRENNQDFELTNGLGNLGLRRPLTHPAGRHNPDSPCKRPKPTLKSWLMVPNGRMLGGNKNPGNKAFLDVLQNLLKESQFLNHTSKLPLSIHSDSNRKWTQAKRNKIMGKICLMLKGSDIALMRHLFEERMYVTLML